MAEAVVIEERTGFALATVMARKGVTAAAIGEALGTSAPEGPRWKSSKELTMIGTGPGTWLVMIDREDPSHAATLQQRLGSLASVSDQSSSYVIFSAAGDKARALLQRGAFIDFDPGIFRPGFVATTVISHIGVVIWQVDDRPTYNIALFRSFAASFRHWLAATSSAF